MKFLQKCTNAKCNAVYTDDEQTPLVCPKCNSPLNINIIQANVGKIGVDFFRTRTQSMWKYINFLPLRNPENIITLGEGATPLLKSNNLVKNFDLKHLYMKNETINPTGSFLDRNISMGISMAKELGYSKAISLSTGNVGAAVAAYSARAGFKSLVVVPDNYRKGKLYQVKLYGGNAIQVNSNHHQKLMEIVINSSKAFKAINLATTSLYNSFTNHGAKTIIYEMFEQLDMSLPDNIIVPVGGAGLLSALIQACMELQELNLIPHIPRFIAVQPNGCHPFVYALRKALTPDQVYSQPWENMNTCISSLATDVPFDYALFYHLQRQMGEGEKVTGVTVSDEEVLDAQRELAKKEGLFVEPASATTVAALAKITNDGIVLGDNACIILTGNGLLDFDQAVQNMVPPPAYDVDINIEKIVQPYFS